MRLPTLTELTVSRSMVETFMGYNHNLRISDGEFYDEKNLTGDYYPLLSPREARGVYDAPKNAQGLIAKDGLCYVDGEDFVINGKPVHMGLSTREEDCPKTLVSMGAYVIILPDKQYINTADTEDRGAIEASYVTENDVTYTLCTVEGAAYQNALASETAPVEPKGGDYWIDTSQQPHSLKVYSASTAMWTTVGTTYIKIQSANIGKAFSEGDGVEISGVKPEALRDLNGSMLVWARGDDWLVVVGILDAETVQKAADGPVTVERRMPVMDYVTESGNRLWGCRYGPNRKGEIVNEIYACKLGDFKNWECYQGVSTDSYAASCGTDGPFTGAITHLGYPLFFKENCLHKVYGSYPANFQIQQTACRGVQKGCGKSLVIVNEVLYYMGRSGVCAYDGSLPAEISGAFGQETYTDAAAGARQNKYYLSAKDSAGRWQMLVYDAARRIWHKEDGVQAAAFCQCQGELYYIDGADGRICTIGGSGTRNPEKVAWMAETGEIGLGLPDKKYIGRLLLRMSMEKGSRVRGYIQYDSAGEWKKVFDVAGSSLRTFTIPVRPRRCDHFRLRLEGEGGMKLYSMTRTIEEGSDM